MSKKILLIYTGGTVGMIKDKKKNTLIPFNFKALLNAIPELDKMSWELDNVSINKPIDSSNMNITIWQEIAEIIQKHYNTYDGFVVLHGTDTMAFSASALSFMLEHLNKAVIFTGSQIPIGVSRTDAKENIITSIEIAASTKIREVCIYFESKLYKGNRTTKINTEDFEAFQSPNHPILADIGVNIKYKTTQKKHKKELIIHSDLSNDIAILKLFPSISLNTVSAILNSAKAIIIESFGAGNAATNPNLIALLRKANENKKILLNITQCLYGSVVKGQYESNKLFKNSGVISGKDLTTEAAVTKLMFLLAQNISDNKIKKLLITDLRGEITN